MLSVTRKETQRVRVGDNVTIEVTQIKGKRVRLAIAAPVEMKIMREELLTRAPKLKR